MRLFIAIDLEENEYFSRLQEPLRMMNGVRATFPNTYHITLQFLGEIEECRLDKLTGLLSSIEFSQFEIKCDRIGAFPNPKNVRVIWAGFYGDGRHEENNAYRAGRDSLIKLAKKIESALKTMNLRPDKEFAPHVTLARIKETDKSGQMEISWALKTLQVEPKVFLVKRFYLFKSELGPRGPLYTRLARFPNE